MTNKYLIASLLLVAVGAVSTNGAFAADSPHTRNFNWVDCAGQILNGSFTVQLTTLASNSYNTWDATWFWPSSEHAGGSCTNQSFGNVDNTFCDFTANFCTDAGTSSNNSQNTPKRFTLSNLVLVGDEVYAAETGAYGCFFTCTDRQTFLTDTWIVQP